MVTYQLPIYDGAVEVQLPERWQVHYAPIKDLPALTPAQIRDALAHPIGTSPIRELARGKRTAAVIVEDLTRPLRGEDVVPYVIDELHAGGISYDDVTIIIGIGAHRPLGQREYRRKLGDRIFDSFLAVNPNLYENQVYVGTTAAGTPVEICRDAAEADIKVSVSSIMPHNGAGFSGGGKLILPGVCSMRTIEHHHSKYTSYATDRSSFGDPECSFRHEIEEVARLAHLDVIVDAVLNSRLDVVGLFVGDLVQAHRAGVSLGWQVYPARAPAGVDVAIISGFPRDYELGQITAALAPNTGGTSVREGGAVLLLGGGQEGVGYHALRDRYVPTRKSSPKGNYDLLVYSPQVSVKEVACAFPEGTRFFDNVEEALAILEVAYPQARANVFPQGAMTIFQPE